jgi:dTDP-4-dehydrorhamnose reductase
LGAELKLKPENIVTVKNLPGYPVKRPANSVLSNDKYQKVFGFKSPKWDYCVDRFLAENLGVYG